MKHILYTFCVSLLVWANLSCDSLLEVEPENTATYYNFFKSEEDIEAVMMEAYYQYRDIYSYSPYRAASGELADDRSRHRQIYALSNLDASKVLGDAGTTWRGYYLIIDQTLLVTENINRLQSASIV